MGPGGFSGYAAGADAVGFGECGSSKGPAYRPIGAQTDRDQRGDDPGQPSHYAWLSHTGDEFSRPQQGVCGKSKNIPGIPGSEALSAIPGAQFQAEGG